MADRKKRLTSLALTLVLVGLNLAALNYLVAGWSTARLDLTEDGIFSLSPTTRRILTSLDEDLTIYGYFSRRTHPKLAPLVPEIDDLLDEYRAVARGRVQVEIIDPGEDEEAAQEAGDRFGVQSTPFQFASKYETAIVNAFFSLVVKYGDQYERYGFEDLIEIDPLPDGDIEVRLRNLEYDLTRSIKKVTAGFRGSLELFEALEDPVALTVIMTPTSLPEVFAEVPEAVRLAAGELEEKGGDLFTYEEIDPTGDEALQQDLYQRYGARPMSLGLFGDESFYLYGLLQVGDRMERLMLTGESLTTADIREAVEGSVRRYIPGFLKTVGVVAPEPSLPPEMIMQYQMQGRMPPTPPPEFQEIKRTLEQDYTVRDIDLKSEAGVPYDVDLLLVLKPRDLGEAEVYHLDQYLMRGGRVVLCAGNYEVDFNPQGLNVRPLTTGLANWLAHFGVTVSRTLVLDDRNQPLPIPDVQHTPFGAIRTWVMAPYPYLVQVRDEGLVNADVAATLDAVGIYWGSPVVVDEEAAGDLEATPILQSSPRSWTSDDTTAVSFVDYQVPAEGIAPQPLAIALSGRFKSFYAGKEAPGRSGAEEDGAALDDEAEAAIEPVEEETAPPTVTLEESPDTRLIVVGNAEFLSDFVARALGQLEGGFFPENLRFMKNLIDWGTLDNEMIAIRSRGVASRRLGRVEKGQEIGIEMVNYLVPTAFLVVLGAYRFWRRKHALPLFTGEGRPAAGAPGEEV